MSERSYGKISAYFNNLLDLSVPNAAGQLYEIIDDLDLSVDYLINNAGFGKFCEFSDTSFETYHKMLMLNINALVQLTYLFLPHIKNKKAGGVINVASTGSFQPLPYQAVYGASKAFVLSFSEALAGELLDTEYSRHGFVPRHDGISLYGNCKCGYI